MSKFGIIYTAYNTEDYVGATIAPWTKAREEKWGGHEYVICAVSCPFKKFGIQTTDKTLAILQKWMGAGAIDCIITKDEPVEETDARGQALTWLTSQGVDFTWQADSDEFFTKDNVEKITKFVCNSMATWFKVSYKNYVFENEVFLVEPFTPARIHRIKSAGFEAIGFWDDNNVKYKNPVTGEMKNDVEFANVTIPKTLAWVKHMTWLNDFRSRLKIEYQKARGWQCSFAWDKDHGLVWNYEYFSSRGLAVPELEAELLMENPIKMMKMDGSVESLPFSHVQTRKSP